MDTKELLGGNAKSNVAFPALTKDSSTHNGLSVKDASVICNTFSGDSGHIEPNRLTTRYRRIAAARSKQPDAGANGPTTSIPAAAQTRKRGIEIRLLDRLVSATSERAILKSALEIRTKTIVSTVPSAIAPVLQQLDCPKDKGRLQVNRKLELAGYEGQVWALGDCASIVTKSGNAVPPTAQHATREAATVAGNIGCLSSRQGKLRI